MREKAESRDRIKQGLEQRKHELDDRGNHMEFVVDDKRTVSDTSGNLRLSGTTEGAEAIKQAITGAAEATHREFEAQEHQLETKLNECQEAEQDLRERTESAKQDATDSRTAAGRIKETQSARDSIAAAERAATEDEQFTDEQRARQEQERQASEQRREEQKRQMASAKLNW